MKTLLITFLIFCSLSGLVAQEVRPVRDSIGYCWNAEQMNRLITYVETKDRGSVPQQSFIAGISPHDDFLYAASVYYPLFQSFRTKEVVIFGVTHATVRKEIGDPQNILLLEEYKEWAGCGRNIAISPLRDYLRSRLDTQYFRVNNQAHRLEHSIEAMVPWLQYFNPDIHITPIMVTAMPFERMDEISKNLSEALVTYIKENKLVPGKDIFFLYSSDANHYGKDFNNVPFGDDSIAHAEGTKRDRQIADKYLAGAIQSEKIRNFTLEMKNFVWCGKFSVPFGLLATQKTLQLLSGKTLTGIIFRYSDSYTEGIIPLKQTGMGTTAPFSLKHWVGYLSAGYFME
ncbi:MAG: AmmeMemoRadiSam system protein B [Ignavibacteriales bacterium]|nr:AmmeMemoRadiSam system protein B [Ignavibacteriales bacterium]